MNRFKKDIEAERKATALKRGLLASAFVVAVAGTTLVSDEIAQYFGDKSIRMETGSAVRDRNIHADDYEKAKPFVEQELAKLNKYFDQNLEAPEVIVISNVAGQGYMSHDKMIITDGMLEKNSDLIREVVAHELGHQFIRKLDLLPTLDDNQVSILDNKKIATYTEKLHADLHESHGGNSKANETLAEVISARMNEGTGSLDYRKSLQPSNVGEYQTQTEASAYLHQGAERIHPSLGRYQDMHEYIDHAKEVGGKTLEQLDNAIKTGNVAEILMQTSRYQTQKHGTEEQVDNLPAMIDASVDKVNMLVTKEYPELQGVETPLMIFPSNNFLRDVDYAGSEHRTLPHLTTRISDRGFGAVQDGTIDLEERINLSIVQQFADNNKAHFDEHNNNWTPFTDEGKQAADKAINELMQKLGYSEEKYPAQKPEGKEVTEAASREVKRIEIDLPAQR